MPRKKANTVITENKPLGWDWETSTASTTRRSRAASIVRTDKYKNLEDIETPFQIVGKYISPRKTLELCRKAYFGFGILRNIIDMMTEFSVGKIHLRGGSKESQKFFQAWFKKINILNLQEQFYREYYRSGNVIIHRSNLTLNQSGNGAKSLKKILGLNSAAKGSGMLPIRYVFINPENIVCTGDISFEDLTYEQILTNYEIARLQNPKTEKDKEFLDTLPEAIKSQLKARMSAISIGIPLPEEQTIFCFYKKQDYEPFGVPMAYPVLEAINFKKELIQIDMAVARTQQQMVLLVTTGAEPEKGGINQDNLKLLNEIFKNESVGRTVIADYTTKVSFIIPSIGDILTEEKYKIVERDINMGLNNILLGDEKFANQSVKVEVFLARLQHGREIFLDEILIPEIKRIADEFNLKNYPIPYYRDIAVKKETEKDKVFVRLSELGILTPDETIRALEEGVLPEQENSRESQQEFKQLRDKEMYIPVNNLTNEAGRPIGSKAPQSTKKVSPIGASDGMFSANKIIAAVKASRELESEVSKHLKQKYNKTNLNSQQIERVNNITKFIIANQPMDHWNETIAMYCEHGTDTTIESEQLREIQVLEENFGLSRYTASILYHSQI